MSGRSFMMNSTRTWLVQRAHIAGPLDQLSIVEILFAQLDDLRSAGRRLGDRPIERGSACRAAQEHVESGLGQPLALTHIEKNHALQRVALIAEPFQPLCEDCDP